MAVSNSNFEDILKEMNDILKEIQDSTGIIPIVVSRPYKLLNKRLNKSKLVKLINPTKKIIYGKN